MTEAHRMKVVVISGTPGTGKSVLAEKLAKKQGWKVISVTDFIDEHNLSKEYDDKRDVPIMDEKLLVRELLKVIEEEKNMKKTKGMIIEGHMAHFLPAKAADCCVILRCGLGELKKRLKKRGYREEKVRENLDSEIFDTCYNEALELGHGPIAFSDRDSFIKVYKALIKAI